MTHENMTHDMCHNMRYLDHVKRFVYRNYGKIVLVNRSLTKEIGLKQVGIKFLDCCIDNFKWHIQKQQEIGQCQVNY